VTTTRSPLGSHWASASELKEQLEAERQGEPFLLFRDGAGAQQIVTLPATASAVTVGRDPQTDVCLDWDHEVSRVHAELARVGPDWTIADDGLSRNGTYVNGDRIKGRLRLRGGDVISMGSTTVAFRAERKELSETSWVRSSERPSVSPSQRRVLVALCRPYRGRATHAAPATNRQIAEEVFLSVEGVKTHIRALFECFGVEDLPQNAKRARLVELALSSHTVTERDFDGVPSS
jgi:pSer/pThr/pTyr-binding forkhead associated (FHA) protein